MISKFFRVSAILALGASSTQAVFLGIEGETAAVSPEYATGDAPDSIPDLLTILDAQGGQGFQFGGLTTLDNPGGARRTTIFVNDRADSETYRYESDPNASVAADFLEQLNRRGAAGFEYLLNFNASEGGVSVDLFEERVGSSVTFEYRVVPRPATLSDFLTLVNDQGGEGFEWLGVRQLRPTAGSNLAPHQLFLRRSTDTAIYTYRSEQATSDAGDSVAQYNSQGSAGFRWIASTFVPGGGPGGDNIFVSSTTRPSTFSYQIEEAPFSRSTFETVADQEGDLGNYYKVFSQFLINGSFGGAIIFVDENPSLPSAGGIDIAENGVVTFVPLEDGNFQLQTSTDLQTFTNSGAGQPGTAGTAMTFNTGAPVEGSRQFYRVATF